jgi:hypothetical protein
LKEYLLVSQQSRSLTQCPRSPGGEWRIETLGDATVPVRLSSIGAELTFEQIYAGAESLP